MRRLLILSMLLTILMVSSVFAAYSTLFRGTVKPVATTVTMEEAEFGMIQDSWDYIRNEDNVLVPIEDLSVDDIKRLLELPYNHAFLRQLRGKMKTEMRRGGEITPVGYEKRIGQQIGKLYFKGRPQSLIWKKGLDLPKTKTREPKPPMVDIPELRKKNYVIFDPFTRRNIWVSTLTDEQILDILSSPGAKVYY